MIVHELDIKCLRKIMLVKIARKKLVFTTILICLSTLRLLSKTTPGFLAPGLTIGVRAPQLRIFTSETLSEPKIMHSVFSSFKLRKFCDSHSLMSSIQPDTFSASVSFWVQRQINLQIICISNEMTYCAWLKLPLKVTSTMRGG